MKKRLLNQKSDVSQKSSINSLSTSLLSLDNSVTSHSQKDSVSNKNDDSWSDAEEERKDSTTAVVTFLKYGLDLNVKECRVSSKGNDRRSPHDEWGSPGNSEPENTNDSKKSEDSLKPVENKYVGGRGKRFLANRGCNEEIDNFSINKSCASGRALMKEPVKHDVSWKASVKDKNIESNVINANMWKDMKSADGSNKFTFPPAELRPTPGNNLSDLWSNMEASNNSDGISEETEKCKSIHRTGKAGPDKDIWSEVKSADHYDKIPLPPAESISNVGRGKVNKR